jgi:methyl-accepting chemotaxis protein
MESIKNRFLIVVSALVVITMGLSTIVSLNLQKNGLEQDKALSIQLSVNAMSDVVAQGLWNYEDEIIKNAVNSAFDNPNLSKVLVINNEGALKYGLSRNNNDTIKEITTLFEDNKQQYFPLMADGSNVGQLAIVDNNDAIDSRISSYLMSVLIQVSVIVVLLIVTLSVLLQSMIFNHLKHISKAFKNIAEGDGDLSQRIEYKKKNEIGLLVNYFNQFIEKIHVSVKDVDNVAHSMMLASDNLKRVNLSTINKVESSQAETTMVATSVNELTQATDEIARNASLAAEKADEVNTTTKATRNIVDTTTKTIDGLSEKIKHGAEVINSLKNDVQNIVSVLEVIRGIAEQTNLLALNAAIEAARAGEQGRGFAVVADEVRALASRTQESTTEIQGMIERLQQGSSQAVEVMDSGTLASSAAVEKAQEAFESLDVILQGISVISDFSIQIATAVEQSSAVTREVNSNVNNINDLASDLVHHSGESNDVAMQVVTDVSELKTMLSKFKL